MNGSNRNVVLGIIGLALLAVAAYRFMTPAPSRVVLPDQYTADVKCLACNEESLVTHDNSQRPPYECPACGEHTAYSWWYCRDCDHRFVPGLSRDGDSWKPVLRPTCGACGCSNVTLFNSKNEFQQPAGDAKLPPWPPE